MLNVFRDVLFDEDEFIKRKKGTQVFDTNDCDSMPEGEEKPQLINQPVQQAIQENQDTIDNDRRT